MVMELPDLYRFGTDPERRLRAVEFPDPVIRQPELARRFLELHRLLERPASTLEREVELGEFLQALLRHGGVAARREDLAGADDQALRRACEYLQDELAHNLTLEQLAAAAEVGFHDQSHLARHFVRIVGLTPGDYRRAATG